MRRLFLFIIIISIISTDAFIETEIHSISYNGDIIVNYEHSKLAIKNYDTLELDNYFLMDTITLAASSAYVVRDERVYIGNQNHLYIFNYTDEIFHTSYNNDVTDLTYFNNSLYLSSYGSDIYVIDDDLNSSVFNHDISSLSWISDLDIPVTSDRVIQLEADENALFVLSAHGLVQYDLNMNIVNSIRLSFYDSMILNDHYVIVQNDNYIQLIDRIDLSNSTLQFNADIIEIQSYDDSITIVMQDTVAVYNGNTRYIRIEGVVSAFMINDTLIYATAYGIFRDTLDLKDTVVYYMYRYTVILSIILLFVIFRIYLWIAGKDKRIRKRELDLPEDEYREFIASGLEYQQYCKFRDSGFITYDDYLDANANVNAEQYYSNREEQAILSGMRKNRCSRDEYTLMKSSGAPDIKNSRKMQLAGFDNYQSYLNAFRMGISADEYSSLRVPVYVRPARLYHRSRPNFVILIDMLIGGLLRYIYGYMERSVKYLLRYRLLQIILWPVVRIVHMKRKVSASYQFIVLRYMLRAMFLCAVFDIPEADEWSDEQDLLDRHYQRVMRMSRTQYDRYVQENGRPLCVRDFRVYHRQTTDVIIQRLRIVLSDIVQYSIRLFRYIFTYNP